MCAAIFLLDHTWDTYPGSRTRNPLLKNGSDKEERENEKRTKRNGRKRSGFVIFVTVYLPQFKEIVGLQ